jgi:hypothetical protein
MVAILAHLVPPCNYNLPFTMYLSIVSLVEENKWQLITVAFFIYVATICIYRRFFHPLAKIPGPFLPAVTMLYQSFCNGRYYLEIERMHEKYGMYKP